MFLFNVSYPLQFHAINLLVKVNGEDEKLTKTTFLGLATVESLKSQIEGQVKNKKKAEIIKSKISGTDLNSIASSFGLTVANADNVNFGMATIGDSGQEPAVVGKIFIRI